MEMGSQSHEAAVEEEEEYINMEINPHSSSSSSPQSKDFEFQHLSSSSSAASDLFYRGKLLPLHLRRPPPFLSAPCTTSNTPSDSCNISPSQSCRPSCDLTTHISISTFTFFFNNNSNHDNHHPPRNNNSSSSSSSSWSKMKKLNKRSYLAHKLKSSRAFLKSLFFTKQSSKSRDDPTSYSRFGKNLPTLISKNGIIDDHRRSFSGAIASSDSSSSSTSSSFNEMQFLRRSSSAAEIEVSIDAAIAHCKKSYATN